jgi:hypothetical protein
MHANNIIPAVGPEAEVKGVVARLVAGQRPQELGRIVATGDVVRTAEVLVFESVLLNRRHLNQ